MPKKIPWSCDGDADDDALSKKDDEEGKEHGEEKDVPSGLFSDWGDHAEEKEGEKEEDGESDGGDDEDDDDDDNDDCDSKVAVARFNLFKTERPDVDVCKDVDSSFDLG